MEAQILRGELIKEKANYKTHIEKQEQELDNNKITNNELQAINEKVKQELAGEKTTNNSLQVNNDKLKKELAAEKTTNNSLQINNDKLKQELAAEKTTNNSLQINNDKLKQELAAEKTTNNSLQVNNDKLVEELELCKATLKIAETKTDKPMKKRGEQRYRLDPVLVQTIRTKAAEEKKKDIFGLAILDRELFAVSEMSSEVEVYDSIKLSFSRRWNLKELVCPWDIASCVRNKCLYISDSKGFSDKSNAILRVDPHGNVIKNWSTGDSLGSLYVTYESTVILASYSHNKLKEYSPDGHLIHEINLSSTAGIRSLWHVIKLTNGHFVVSHGNNDDMHIACIVDSDGKPQKSFGGRCGSAIGQMNRPVYLSVDANGFVMVVHDQLNRRVLLLDEDLKFKKDILSKEKDGLRYPWRILLDEINGRLFVADNDSGNRRILVFDQIVL